LTTAGAVFTDALLKAMRGDKDIVQCTYIESPLYADKGVAFFASQVTLGVRPLPPLLYVNQLTINLSAAQRC
jgi:hypothetical protein